MQQKLKNCFAIVWLYQIKQESLSEEIFVEKRLSFVSKSRNMNASETWKRLNNKALKQCHKNQFQRVFMEFQFREERPVKVSFTTF